MKTFIKLITVLGSMLAGSSNCGAQSTSPAAPSFCIEYLKDFIPHTTDPVLEIKVHFWIMSSSLGNAWGNMTTADADNLLANLNSRFNNLQPSHISVASPIPGQNYYIPSAKVKFVRSGFTPTVTFAYSEFFADTAASALMLRMIDPNAMNLVFGDCSKCQYPYPPDHPLADSPQVCGVYGAAINMPGYYGNLVTVSAAGLTNPVLTGTNLVTTPMGLKYIDYSSVITHELSHALGNTSHTCDGPSFINITQGCCTGTLTENDSPLETGPAYGDLGAIESCTNTAISNNFVSANLSCMEYLSPQQCAIMHYNLRNGLIQILSANSYNNDLQRNPVLDRTLTSDETWTRDYYCKGDIIVPNGKTFTIKCMVGMAQGTRIIVEPKAQLIIDGGTLKNISGHTWRGVEVRGDPNSDQSIPLTTNGIPSFQGIVRIINNGTISNAEIGVRAYKMHVVNYAPAQNHVGVYVPGFEGGMIIANNANFTNNARDIEFRGLFYTLLSGSYFIKTRFKTTGVIGTGRTPIERVRLSRVYNLKFMECTFEYAAGTMYGSHGNGISSFEAGFNVDKLCSLPTSQCNFPSIFKNLDYGIYADNMNSLLAISVQNSKFENNSISGAYLHATRYAYFDRNYFGVGNGFLSNGMYLHQSKYYSIKNNQFKYTAGGNGNIGIYVYDSRDGAHAIYRNSFESLGIGIAVIGNNLGTIMPTTPPLYPITGLKMNCNNFSNINNLFDIGLMNSGPAWGNVMPSVMIQQGTIVGNDPLKLVRNRYSVLSSCGNNNMWYVDPSSNITIQHGCSSNNSPVITDPSQNACASLLVNVSTSSIIFSDATHCVENPPSSGGGSGPNPPQQLTNLNNYLAELDGMGTSADPFEVQATFSAKLNYYLMDSLPGAIDTVIHILTENKSNMEDADLQLVDAYMIKGQFSTAASLVNAMGSNRSDWKDFLEHLLDIYENEPKGIYCLDSATTFESYLENLADAGKDGDGAARAALKFMKAVDYDVPKNLPPGLESLRPAQPTPADEKQMGKPQIEAYPNPFKNGFNLFYRSDDTAPAEMEVRDLLGRQIYRVSITDNSEQYIPMKDFSSGIYILLVTKHAQLLHTSKLIKQD